ncbi:hypothetical protein FRC07_004687 [Ceratobasidium sp. 392]|nr:hypothetical protein FRC07_004687 [Ceratobasidium sp. 392]
MSTRLTAPSGLSYRDRSSLLPSGSNSGRSSPYPYSNTPPQGQRFAEDLEGQNDERLEGLTAKVKLLKDITIGIGNEVRDSTVQLSQMVRCESA